MNCKSNNPVNEVEFREWMCGLALAELKKAPDMSKAQNLSTKVKAFIQSENVEKQGLL